MPLTEPKKIFAAAFTDSTGNVLRQKDRKPPMLTMINWPTPRWTSTSNAATKNKAAGSV